MTEIVVSSFELLGDPVPQGSMVAVLSKNDGRPFVKPSNETALRRFRKALAEAAWVGMARRSAALIEKGPVAVVLTYEVSRPASHLGTGRNAGSLRPSAPTRPATRPDGDKIERAVLDALTGVCFKDDGQVVEVDWSKRFAAPGSPSRTVVTVWALEREEGAGG